MTDTKEVIEHGPLTSCTSGWQEVDIGRHRVLAELERHTVRSLAKVVACARETAELALGDRIYWEGFDL